ncbi:MAG TPA: hypothetical protein ENN81_06500 [Phycisphaerales bacterium]|nr:hypothetical protein [Phycisphaerales bacterium]
MGGMGGMGGFGAAPTDLALGEDLFGRPPFAPASAIELVVLPRRDSVQLTIYNSADLTLVRERRNLTLKRGWNWLQFMWANTLIDPTSLHLEPLDHAGQVEVQQLVYPAGLSQIGRWLIRSQYEGQSPFEITYFTSGLNWRAFYMGTLSADETKMALEGYVRVDNASGEDYEQAQTRLIVGQVHLLDEIAALARRQRPYGPDPVVADAEGAAWGEWGRTNLNGDHAVSLNGVLAAGDVFFGFFGTGKPKEIHKEGLSEYFLYTIEGTETIANQWGKRLGSFSAEDVNVTSLYKYDEQRWGQEAIRFVSFVNDEEHNLGQTPLPNGDVRIYAVVDAAGGLSYVGGTQVKYIPVNEKVELNLGPARLVKVEPKLMAFDTQNHTFDYQRNVNGWDEVRAWRIELTNTRELPVDIEITRGFETSYWDLTLVDPASMAADAVGYEKHDVTHGRFKTTVQPRSLKSFGYTVRTYHGERERAWK